MRRESTRLVPNDLGRVFGHYGVEAALIPLVYSLEILTVSAALELGRVFGYYGTAENG